MRISYQVLATAALAVPFASAASLDDLPACALTAATSSISSTGCKPTDYSCLCRATSFLTALQGQVSSSCSPSDYASTLSFAQNACSAVGITLSLPQGSSAAGPEATSASSASEATAQGSMGGSSTSMTAPMASTTGSSANSTNGTISTSQPVVPFEGLAATLRFQAAFAALLVATAGAFVAL